MNNVRVLIGPEKNRGSDFTAAVNTA